MNFQQRLLRFAIGIGIGILLSMWMLGNRGCTEWFPAQRIRTSIQMAGIRPSASLRCVEQCLDTTLNVEAWLLAASPDWDASAPRDTPQVYVFAHPAGQPIERLAFTLTDTAALVTPEAQLAAHCGCTDTP